MDHARVRRDGDGGRLVATVAIVVVLGVVFGVVGALVIIAATGGATG
jgi:hypothetical protein